MGHHVTTILLLIHEISFTDHRLDRFSKNREEEEEEENEQH